MIKKVRIIFYIAGFAVMLLTVGCGGFSGSHSVSPASMFMPGLMKNENPDLKPGHNNTGPLLASVPAK
jgi:hypothetical protein